MFNVNGERVALVCDTACDLSEEQLARYDIRVVALRISTSRGDLRDRTEISQAELYQLLEKELPKTSLPQPEDVTDLYRSLQAEGCDRIVHLCMSSGLSGTCNMVRMLAAEMPIVRVDVVDTLTLSCGEGLLVLAAARALESGCSVEEAILRVERLRRTQLGTFVIRTLEYLRKGGRIGLVGSMVGNLLNLKPVIFVNDNGVYETLQKARGFNKALTALTEEYYRRYGKRPVNLAVVHGNVPEDGQKLLEEMRGRLNTVESFLSPVSPALAIHTGPGLLGAIVQDAD